MCDGYLIRLPDGNEICIPIYREIVEFKFGPDPDPGPYRDLLQDVTVLATISHVAQSLTHERAQHQVARAIQVAAADLANKLPEGVQLGQAAFGVPAQR